MKKSVKLSLYGIAIVVLYVGLFYLMTSFSSPEESVTSLATFYGAVIFGIIAIPVGMALEWFLSKKKLEKKKKDMIILVVAVIYGFLLGWVTLLALAFGAAIVEKDGKK